MRRCQRIGCENSLDRAHQRFCSRACQRAHFDALRPPETADHREMCEIVRRDPCTYCGATDEYWKVGIGVDHIVPQSRGGERDANNVTGCCRDCNSSKCARSFLEFLLDSKMEVAA